MKIRAWLVILGLGPFAPGCWADRPLYFATTPDASLPSGAAGSAAGTTGTAGGAGTSAAGTGAAGAAGCDINPLFIGSTSKYMCTLAGACHDAMGSAARFSLAELSKVDAAWDGGGSPPSQVAVDWRAKLVGVFPKGGGAIPSQCFPSQVPYLIAGSSPARGLLLDKLRNPTCGDQMPMLTGPVSAADMDCIQRWANELTAP